MMSTTASSKKGLRLEQYQTGCSWIFNYFIDAHLCMQSYEATYIIFVLKIPIQFLIALCCQEICECH